MTFGHVSCLHYMTAGHFCQVKFDGRVDQGIRGDAASVMVIYMCA